MLRFMFAIGKVLKIVDFNVLTRSIKDCVTKYFTLECFLHRRIVAQNLTQGLRQ